MRMGIWEGVGEGNLTDLIASLLGLFFLTELILSSLEVLRASGG